MGLFLALTMLLYTGAALLLCAARCLHFERRLQRYAQRTVKQRMINEKVKAAIAATTREATAPQAQQKPLGRGRERARTRRPRTSPVRRHERSATPPRAARAKAPFELDSADAKRWGFVHPEVDDGASHDPAAWLRRELSRADKDCWGFGENQVYNGPIRPGPGPRDGGLAKQRKPDPLGFGRELDRADTDSWGLGGSLTRLPGTTRLASARLG